jgi:hypothetical protein
MKTNLAISRIFERIYIDTDASNEGIGAILSQGQIGKICR